MVNLTYLKFNFQTFTFYNKGMLSQQAFTKKVVQHLREHHSIRLNLPNLFRSIDSKVTLKYLKSFALNKNQHRYQILTLRIDQLLKKNLLNLDKIKQFSEDFFNTITEDILILEQNERLRKKIPLAKEKILVKNEQIGGFEQNIKIECLLINDKQDVINFISSSLKDYLNKLNVIANEYNTVNKLEILTSINIDELYQDSLSDESDYTKHYPPLLEVLNKLKSNMIRLYQEIETSDPYDVPLRCVNFLANCKNLIQEMEPFLLSDDCAFNRMIFYVVKCQKENLQLVAANYQKALVFCREITSDLFKSYYLGFMFKPSYLQIRQSLEAIRQSLLKMINDQELPQLKLNQLLKSQIVKLQQIKQRTKQLKAAISVGKNNLMKVYVSKKECKKIELIKKSKEEWVTLKKMIEKFSKYYQMKKHVQKLDNKQVEESSKIIKQVKMLEKMNDLREVVKEEKERNKDKVSPQQRFEATFIRLQQLMLQVSTLKSELQLQLQSHQDEHNNQLLLEYITHRIHKLSTINSNYLSLQTKLLNTFIAIQTQAQQLQQESLHAKEQTIELLEKYFESRLNQNLGFLISNEDNLCQEVKQKIIELGKAQYMIKEWKKGVAVGEEAQKAKKDQDQIKFYRNNLQWLLVLFEGSMDEKIFQLMMDKLNFDAQDYVEKEKKVQQFITELNKYVNDLKNLLKSHPLSQIHPKIYKIIKDRIQLYEIINDIYSECLLVFKQTKKKDFQFNIENKGLLLFDEGVFKYVLMVYQFRNKLRMEMAELRELMLPPRARNYLIDELYEPFEIRFGQYINYKEEELLNFTLRLQHALNIEQGQKKILELFEQVIKREYSEDYFANVEQICKEMVQISKENGLVVQLEHEPVVVHNLEKFKELILPYEGFYRLAEQVIKDLQRENDHQMKAVNKLSQQETKPPKISELMTILLKRWQEHHGNNNENDNLEERIDNRSNYQGSQRSRADSRSRLSQVNSNKNKALKSEKNSVGRLAMESRFQGNNYQRSISRIDS